LPRVVVRDYGVSGGQRWFGYVRRSKLGCVGDREGEGCEGLLCQLGRDFYNNVRRLDGASERGGLGRATGVRQIALLLVPACSFLAMRNGEYGCDRSGCDY